MKKVQANLKDKKLYKILEPVKAKAKKDSKTSKTLSHYELEKEKMRKRLIRAFNEVKLIEEGKLKPVPLEKFLKELNEV